MKHLFTVSLLCGAMATLANAQSVTVITKDGKVTIFDAKEVKEITFEEKAPVEEPVRFIEVEGSAYSVSNAGFTFRSADGSELTLDIYTEAAGYLKAGEYAVGGSEGLYIDKNEKYTYYKVGDTTLELKSGKMTVDYTGVDYSLGFDFILSDESILKGSYEGSLPAYAQYNNVALSACNQFDLDSPAPGEFYMKLNDTNWKYEVVLDFFLEPGSKVIPTGVYNLNENEEAPCYGPYSQVDKYSPNATIKINTPVTVEDNDENTVIKFEVADENGVVYNFTFDGLINYIE